MKSIITAFALSLALIPSLSHAKCSPSELESQLRKEPFTVAFNDFQVSAGFAYGSWVTKYDEVKMSSDKSERKMFLDLGRKYMKDAMSSVESLYQIAVQQPRGSTCREEMKQYIKTSGEDMVKFHNEMIAEFVR